MTRYVVVAHAKFQEHPDLSAAIAQMQQQGFSLSVEFTKSPDAVAEFMSGLSKSSITPPVIIPCGGDGTINLVLGAACDAGLSDQCGFGILPMGTANDFARTLRVPANDPLAALKIATGDVEHRIDAGKINGKWFFNAVTGGFGAQVTQETDSDLKNALGGLSYLLSGVSRLDELESCEGVFNADGFEWDGRFVGMAVANGRFAGGGVPLSADGSLNDGLLDLVIMPNVSEEVARRSFVDVMTDARGTFLVRHRADKLTIEADVDLHFSIDGEAYAASRVDIECVPNLLKMRMG